MNKIESNHTQHIEYRSGAPLEGPPGGVQTGRLFLNPGRTP